MNIETLNGYRYLWTLQLYANRHVLLEMKGNFRRNTTLFICIKLRKHYNILHVSACADLSAQWLIMADYYACTSCGESALCAVRSPEAGREIVPPKYHKNRLEAQHCELAAQEAA